MARRTTLVTHGKTIDIYDIYLLLVDDGGVVAIGVRSLGIVDGKMHLYVVASGDAKPVDKCTYVVLGTRVVRNCLLPSEQPRLHQTDDRDGCFISLSAVDD